MTAPALLMAVAQLLGGLLDVSALAVSPPKTICELDANVMSGAPRRLSWSPDDSSLHLQTLDGDLVRDFIVTLPEGELSLAFGEPEWAARYWATKAGLAALGRPGLKIDVVENHQRTRPVPFANGFAPYGGNSWDPRNPVDTFAIEVKLTVLGHEVGYFLNDAPYGGVTFGWGPAGSGALTFVDDKGRVFLLDRDKHKRDVPGTKDAVLPAWSNDGARVAFVQKAGRRNYRLMIATLTRRPASK